MPAKDFLDTNLFIYHLEGLHSDKGRIANEIIRAGLAAGTACISYQVVQECLNTALRKAAVPLDSEGSRRYMDTVLAPLMRVPSSIDLFHRGLDIQARYKYAFYDALIIAAALASGCSRLLSEDLHHGQQIDQLRIENPFL